MTRSASSIHRPARFAVLMVALIATAVPVPGTAAASPSIHGAGEGLIAGAAVVDATWHVGASQGQYAGEGPGPYDMRTGGLDPSVHAVSSNPTHGVESRDTVRAMVLEDADARRWALVTNDLYIPQDLIGRRVATLLAEHDLLHPESATGITADTLTVSVSHSHSSPFYSSTAWGVWAFQDTFDIRFFEFMARKMADAVLAAASDMRPARAAAATIPVAIAKRNPEAPAVSEEREPLPAGWPMTETDATLTLLRVDDLSGAAPVPLAHWVVFGRHPEGMKDNGMHSGEYVNALERVLDREEGGIALFSQSDVGTSEVTRQAKAHPPEGRHEYDENSHNMLERVARMLADHVQAASRDIDRRWNDDSATLSAATQVALIEPDAPLGVSTMRFAPPSYRPSGTVSNCRTERAATGDPGVPVVGLPDCTFIVPQELTAFSPVNPVVTYDTLRHAGVPIPDNYGFPSYAGLQETVQAPLQAIRLGGVAFTMCSCEQFTDQARNIRSRLDTVPGNFYFGWDWTANHRFNPGWEPGVAYIGDLLPDTVLGEGVKRGPVQLDLDPNTPGDQWWCEPDSRSAPTKWTCKDPRVLSDREPRVLPAWNAWPTLAPVSHGAFVRWKARIYNDARGWDEYLGDDDATPNTLEAESEPDAPEEIWGNWTHEELTPYGYEIIVPVSMANDYWGYIPTYREFQARDYYRKALAGLGPHSSDFLTTRLTRMAAELNGAPDTLVEYSPKDLAYRTDEIHQTARAEAIGGIAEAGMPLYEAALPADGGVGGTPVEQPQPAMKRFGVASFRWVGGSNYADVPRARVERQDSDGTWRPFGDGFGEVQMEVKFPRPEEMPAVEAGAFTWIWTATFEVYDSDIERTFADGVRRDQIPDGTYRFVVDGCHRGLLGDGTPQPGCSPWDLQGRVSEYRAVSDPFTVAPWDGITVGELVPGADWRSVAFEVGPEFPYPLDVSNAALTTYQSATGMLRHTPLPYTNGLFDYGVVAPIDYPDTPPGGHPMAYVTGRSSDDLAGYGGGEQELFCFRCSFEPWAETGAVASVAVTVLRGDGGTERIEASYDVVARRWGAAVDLEPGDRVLVGAGDVTDTFGEFNGEPSPVLERPLP